VDLAAERGGNCELTKAGQPVVAHGVTILGPVNVPSMVPFHASQMYSSNITAFFTHMLKDGALNIERARAILDRRDPGLAGQPADVGIGRATAGDLTGNAAPASH